MIPFIMNEEEELEGVVVAEIKTKTVKLKALEMTKGIEIVLQTILGFSAKGNAKW